MGKLYENIRARRIALHMTQQELAKKLGYKSTSAIAKIESGENDIPQSKIAAFAAALDTTPANLMGLNAAATVPDVPADRVTVSIAKGKPQLEGLIRRLDGLSEKNLLNIIRVNNALIDSYESGQGFLMILKETLIHSSAR